MSILPIYVFDHPILRKKAEIINTIDDSLIAFIADMKQTMHYADGIGLAANQVGSPLSLTVIDISPMKGYEKTKPLTLINPKILYYSDEETDYEEGCLSLPNLRDTVIRPDAIQVRYMDENMKEHTIEADGLLARVLQHEIDHLNGIYFSDRLSSIRKTLIQSKLKKISRGDISPDYDIVLSNGELITFQEEK